MQSSKFKGIFPDVVIFTSFHNTTCTDTVLSTAKYGIELQCCGECLCEEGCTGVRLRSEFGVTRHNERRTTNDERRTTNDERRTTNDERTNDERRTTNDERRMANANGDAGWQRRKIIHAREEVKESLNYGRTSSGRPGKARRGIHDEGKGTRGEVML